MKEFLQTGWFKVVFVVAVLLLMWVLTTKIAAHLVIIVSIYVLARLLIKIGSTTDDIVSRASWATGLSFIIAVFVIRFLEDVTNVVLSSAESFDLVVLIVLITPAFLIINVLFRGLIGFIQRFVQLPISISNLAFQPQQNVTKEMEAFLMSFLLGLFLSLMIGISA